MPKNYFIRQIVIVVFFVSCGIAFSTCQHASENRPQRTNSSSDASKMAILATVNELSKLPVERGKPLDETTRNRIYKLVEGLTSPEDIATLARICRAFMIHDWPVDGKSDSDLEIVYDEAFWRCVKVLSGNSSEGKKRQLERLRETSSLNDTESGYFTSILEGKPFP